jgi:hypothetical protein
MDTTALIVTSIAATGTFLNMVINFYKKPLDKWWDERLSREKPIPPKPKRRMFADVFFSFVLPALVVVDLMAFQPLTKLVLFQIVLMTSMFFSNITIATITRNREWVMGWISRHQDYTLRSQKRHIAQSEAMMKHFSLFKQFVEGRTQVDTNTVEIFEKLVELTGEMRKEIEERNRQEDNQADT